MEAVFPRRGALFSGVSSEVSSGALQSAQNVTTRNSVMRANVCGEMRARAGDAMLVARHSRLMGWTPPGFFGASLCQLASWEVECQHQLSFA
jgi:hypothetical protein